MIRFILVRILQSVPTVFLVITASFFIMRLAPGNPFLGIDKLPPAIKTRILAAYNLDKSIIDQYFDYIANVLRGDFGPSFKYKDFSVTEIISTGLPVSMELGLWAAILSVVFGILIGLYSGMNKDTYIDTILGNLAQIGSYMPNFILAPLLALIFGVYLHWLPVSGWGDGDWQYKILPIVSLTIPQIDKIAWIARGEMIEVLNSNFILTARAKGLSDRVIIYRHALKPILIPVVSYLGPAIVGLITGSVVVETIFGIPGIGRHFVIGALNRDYSLVMGVVIFYSSLMVLVNLLVDVSYALLDPKITLD